MSLFRLDASIRIDGSHSREIADTVEAAWRETNPDAPVTRRHIGLEPVPATAWADSVSAGQTPVEKWSDGQRAARALAAAIVDELVAADALLFAVPLYNYGVSQHFKTYTDLAITDPRLAAGVPPAIAGKPAVLVTVRGGGYGAGTPREGWDHATPYTRRVLADLWQLDLKVVEAEFTLAGENPALADFRDLAAQLRAEAESSAREHGRSLSRV
ncbi:FMN-dependent NADH-azoreductase [Polymorphospora rubra]|uniref:FMN-dependent NADH-azoreductase n=1 Tax=Polymorphospora rubra TaxID=338584 RepID=A0A810MTH4_9ACTN|nr:NAD(P)H-dependent oxidoreductase [Polymorphospora rubra]BCJ64262.1 FMN-dependent NADH-azoreductase [Polymorphospora rubra]